MEQVHQWFEYCLHSGVLTRDGKPVGWSGARGHLKVTLYFPGEKRTLFVHVVVFAMLHGYWPDHIVDHWDGDKLNNQYWNLRPADHCENSCNRGPAARSQSGYKGVHPSRRRPGYWDAVIEVSRRKVRLGQFDDPRVAALAYDAAARAVYGEFAWVNIPIADRVIQRCVDATSDEPSQLVSRMEATGRNQISLLPIGSFAPGVREACYNRTSGEQF